MPLNAHQCPQESDSVAEYYVMDLLDEQDTGIFEEHLLLCEVCRARVADAGRYVRAMNGAAAQIRSKLN